MLFSTPHPLPMTHLSYLPFSSIIYSTLNSYAILYKTIIFDFDGTLCSSLALIHYSMQKTFINFGYPPPDLSTISNMCQKAPNLKDSFFLTNPDLRKLDDATLEKWEKFYRNTYTNAPSEYSKLYPGTTKLIHAVKALDIECLMISNKSTASIKNTLDLFNLSDQFSEIYGSDLSFPPKPAPSIFTDEILPSRPDHTPRDFLMVGDTETDFWFAQACHIDMAWATYGYGDINSVDESQIKYQFKNPIDLIPLLQSTLGTLDEK